MIDSMTKSDVSTSTDRSGPFVMKIAPEAARKRWLALLSMFLAILVILGGGGFATFFSLQAEQDAREQVVRTQVILGSLRDLLRGAVDAETSIRGYLLTGDKKYLQYYGKGTDDVSTAMTRLKSSLVPVASPSQLDKLGRLEETYNKKIASLELKLRYALSGRRAEAIALMSTDAGHILMEEARRLTAELESQEDVILIAALGRTKINEDRSVQALILLGGVVIAILGLSIWLAIRSMNDELRLRAAKADQEASEQASLLSRELNHRVKNLFAVILSIVSLSTRDATDVKTATLRIRERIMALSRAHEVTQGKNVGESAELSRLIELVLMPFQAGNGSARAKAGGPEVTMPVKMVTPLGLIFHEWATNAAKYGALSQPGGTVDIRWEIEAEDRQRRLVLHWSENGGPAISGPPDHSGFGSMLIRASAENQIGGTLDIDWPTDGMKARLVVPLDEPA